MSIAHRLSELLSQTEEPRQGFLWKLYQLISPGLSTLEMALAAAIIANMMAESGSIDLELAQAIAELVEKWDRFKLLPDPAEALAVILVIHKGGNKLMSIIEKVMQPLLNAQRELGRTEGHAAGRTEGHAAGHTEGRTEGHAAGRTEGHAESNTQWRDWLNRKATTEAAGRSFNEPPPDERE